MGAKPIGINDIKPLETFSFQGCHYFKTKDGEIRRSCLEKLNEEWEKWDATLKTGLSPEYVAKYKLEAAQDIAEMEADLGSTKSTYEEVVEAQEGIISLFKNDLIPGKDCSNKVEESEEEYTIFIPNATLFGAPDCVDEMEYNHEITFEDLDDDGLADQVDIFKKKRSKGYSLNYNSPCLCSYITFAWEDPAKGVAESSRDSYKLGGQSFEPLISSLLTFVKEA